MGETMAQRQDPSSEWADLLQGLTPVQRENVLAALRSSASSGWPATREGVSILVAYTQGRITSREYATQVMVALGFADAHTAAALIAQRSQSVSSWRSSADSLPSSEPHDRFKRFDPDAGYDFLFDG